MKNQNKPLGAVMTLAAGAVTAVTLGTLGGIGHYIYNMVIKRGSKDYLMDDPRLTGGESINVIPYDERRTEQYDKWREETTPVYAEIKSFDGLRLAARIYKTGSSDNHKWVIAVHGYNATGDNLRRQAFEFSSELGMNVLTPDCRGHGDSAGRYIGMGWHDRLDIVSWVSYIIEIDPLAEIVLYGISMGAAAVMMAAGEKLPSNVCCVIEDCGYTSLWDELSWQFERAYKIKSFPALNAANAVCRIRAGYNLKKVSAVEQLKKSKLPILFIHGEEDRFVPYPMVFALYQEARRPKDIFTVPGAGHIQCGRVDPDGYWAKIKSFVEKYI